MQERRSKRSQLAEEDYFLINKVRKAKFIYKWNHKDYSDGEKRKFFFSDVARDMKMKFLAYKNIGVDGAYIKKDWYNLRNLFRQALKANENLTPLLQEAKNAMGFLEKWVLARDETRYHGGNGESDSEYEEQMKQTLNQQNHESDSSSIDDANEKVKMIDVHESITLSSGDESDSSDEETKKKWQMVYLAEDEADVLQYVQEKSKNDAANVKVENSENLYDYEEMNGAEEGSFKENKKEKWMMYQSDDEDAVLEYVKKKSLEEAVVVKDSFDKQFSNKKTVQSDTHNDDIKPMMSELINQSQEMEKLNQIQDRVEILCGILKQLPVDKFLAALDIIDSIFEKYNDK